MKLFPIFADLKDRPVLVVGGGAVAERKTLALLEAHADVAVGACLLYTSPSPRDKRQSRMPSSA